MSRPGQKNTGFLKLLAIIIVVFIAYSYIVDTPEWKSRFNQSDLGQTTSTGLSYTELASHAVFTYGFDCDMVVSHGEMTHAGYYTVTCSSGVILRVYPRRGELPEILDSADS